MSSENIRRRIRELDALINLQPQVQSQAPANGSLLNFLQNRNVQQQGQQQQPIQPLQNLLTRFRTQVQQPVQPLPQVTPPVVTRTDGQGYLTESPVQPQPQAQSPNIIDSFRRRFDEGTLLPAAVRPVLSENKKSPEELAEIQRRKLLDESGKHPDGSSKATFINE